MELNRIIHLREDENRKRVELVALPAGRDLIVYLYGGDAHIGAVGVGYCYDLTTNKSNSSVIAVYGHKEDDLVKKVSAKLAKELGVTSVVIAGIHYAQLSDSEIKKIIQNVEKLIENLIKQLQRSAD